MVHECCIRRINSKAINSAGYLSNFTRLPMICEVKMIVVLVMGCFEGIGHVALLAFIAISP
jgi:hypothetical protein